MNARAEKELRNGVNRRVNCEAANLDKAVDAAQEQLEAIRRLMSWTGWRAFRPTHEGDYHPAGKLESGTEPSASWRRSLIRPLPRAV